MNTLTDAQRITYTLERLQGWRGNLLENAEHALAADPMNPACVRAAHAASTRAGDLLDIIAMLDGTEDPTIALYLSARGLS